MKKATKIIISLITALCVTGTAVAVDLLYSKKTAPTEELTLNTEQEKLRVGIISDLQLPDSSEPSHQTESLEKTLNMLNEKGIDALIISGDFTDLGTKKAWQSFSDIYTKAMKDSNAVPLFIMGNHDYWIRSFFESGDIPTPAKMQRRFTKYTGEYPLSHKVINGYHFIMWGSSNGSYDKSYTNKEWARAEIEKAIADNPQNPVFVITHINPTDTAYGSDEWGNDDINEVLSDYSEVISISSHSHYSVIDERSIWQGAYTAFTTQSLDYIELESGKFNGSIPKDAYGNNMATETPGCLYMEIESSKITINRLEANTGKPLKEPWVINAPFGTKESLSNFTQSRKNEYAAPVMNKNTAVSFETIKDINSKEQKIVSFPAAQDDDFVHSYRIAFKDESNKILSFDETDYDGNIIKYDKNGNKILPDGKGYENAEVKKINNVLYFSDFMRGLGNMSETVSLRLVSNIPENAKYIEISAVDSWGAESEKMSFELN